MLFRSCRPPPSDPLPFATRTPSPLKPFHIDPLPTSIIPAHPQTIVWPLRTKAQANQQRIHLPNVVPSTSSLTDRRPTLSCQPVRHTDTYCTCPTFASRAICAPPCSSATPKPFCGHWLIATWLQYRRRGIHPHWNGFTSTSGRGVRKDRR